MSLLSFVLAFSLIMALLNIYIQKRFLAKLFVRHQTASLLFVIILFALELLFTMDRAFAVLPRWTALHLTISLAIGMTTVLFFVAAFYDLLISSAKRIPYNKERRYFFKIIFDTTIIILAFTYLFKGIKGGNGRPRLNEVEVKIKGLDKDLVIMQLSDMHIGKTIKKDDVADMVQRSNQVQPDIVVLTGDIIDDDVDAIKEDLAPLGDLHAPVFFILGNHEYFHGAKKAIDHIKTLGIRTLINDSIIIQDRLNLVGLSDLMGKHLGSYILDADKAFKKQNHDLPTVLLSHQPKSILVVEHKKFDLMLAGHTHGGQIFPLTLLVKLDQPYLAGLYDHNKHKQIFVSRGSGYWGPPIRFLAPAEITKVTLTKA